MSLQVFIADSLEGDTLSLDGPEGKHAVTVKRTAVGEHIKLVDANGAFAICEVIELPAKDRLIARVLERGTEPLPKPSVTVFQAVPKSERSELTVDLLTQAGVDVVVPWQASRCVAKWQGAKRDKAVAKWEQAARAAAKQSRRARLPRIEQPHSTQEVAARLDAFDAVYVLHESATVGIKDCELGAAASLALIIGPEGGISPEELEAFSARGALALKLGPEVLRTATAGMVALAAIGMKTSRW
ncbi:16S rRNA (uracil(1498)-N(3))-methyltransferase [Corynebacterium pseudopelargi]|uniref:Ribosomal RNA small subunit methyltransferase E n=1 Tax=Corynebacterium pseudopelargi TaxID=2080757 RepID=A0A3G6IVW0_9CORY|nr:16S rRNA (uracil(1498)-N(3))-methyltransferase [Corynebacterium pseudopelargi]AZA08798.1 Ribosomal RNA small subunit methyltransferase E [Corynebacterium pseudopelargi]